MGKDHRGLGGGEGVPCCLDRGVGQVHDDPQPVHFLHYSLKHEGDKNNDLSKRDPVTETKFSNNKDITFLNTRHKVKIVQK